MFPGTNLHQFDVHNDGYFSHLPLTYVDGVILEMAVRMMPYEEFAVCLEEKCGCYFQEISGRLNLYLDHLDMNLSEYLSQAITYDIDDVSKIIGPHKKRTSTTEVDATDGVDAIDGVDATDKGKEKVSQDATDVVQTRRSWNHEDPFISVEKHVERYPMYDEITHWRLRKPKVGEKYVSVAQFKECLTYYAMVNGFSLWSFTT
ncbi:hypothetical protein Tco_0405334, partial [Tanacetum coccineum]